MVRLCFLRQLLGWSREDVPVLVSGFRDGIRVRRVRRGWRYGLGTGIGQPVQLGRDGGALRVESFESCAQFLNPRFCGGSSRFHSMRPFVVAQSRPGLRRLKSSHDDQGDHDDEEQTESAAWPVAPIAAVRPGRQRTDEKQNQDD